MSSSELADLLGAARACAEACEAYLASTRSDAVAAAAAGCRVLDDLLDGHPDVLLAGVTACRQLARAALDETPELAAALRRVVESASAVLEASG